ncbi:MAG: DNA ligase, partial [Chitinophagaceae bacterium]|nr:DNA ligase [Chitinophagaceae bacterium]
MALTTYKQKRSFNQTPEPTGGKAKAGELRFVIQKHDASRLHYDFRLEMEGVLKSWAVPKGPSTDPAIRRLAMMVEDHPYDYRDFEGIIPEGNYGAGTVIVWDEGTYTPIENFPDKKSQEKYLLKQLKEGSLKFVLYGKKLKGEFALVRTNGMGDNSWLLIKHRDKYASDTEITEKDKSVQSGKTIDKVASTSKKIWGRKIIEPGTTAKDKSAPVKEKPAPKKTTAKKASTTKPAPVKKKINADLDDAPKAPFPQTVSPMLATLVDKPFDQPGWLYEIKWDGYRALSLCNKSEVNIISRNNKSFNEKFYPIYEAVKLWGIYGIADGEIAVLNDKGISNFGALQNWRSEADGEIVYYVFDLLWLDGHDLT